jgi:hypothetical protein
MIKGLKFTCHDEEINKRTIGRLEDQETWEARLDARTDQSPVMLM